MMLFHTHWDVIDTSEEGQKRLLAVFAAWTPPDGFEIKGFYAYTDGSGGFNIAEADSAATVARATGPFTPWLRFTTVPIVEIQEFVGIAQEAISLRDSVS